MTEEEIQFICLSVIPTDMEMIVAAQPRLDKPQLQTNTSEVTETPLQQTGKMDENGLPLDKYACVLKAAVEKGNHDLLKTLLEEHQDSYFRKFERWQEEEEKGKDFYEFSEEFKKNEDTSRLHLSLQFEIDIAMEAAILKEDLAAVDILIRYAEPLDNSGLYPVHIMTVRMGKVNMMRMLMEERGMTFDEVAECPLQIAADEGHVPMLEFLIEKGLNVNVRGGFKMTALCAAAVNGHIKCAALLLKAGANVNATNRSGETALHVAARREDRKLVTLLLDNHADTNVKTKRGMLPWMCAASSGNLQMAKELLGSADVNEDMGDHNTLLHRACMHGDDCELVKILLEMGADINRLNDRNQTPVLIAAPGYFGRRSRSLLITLIKAGADCSLKDADGMTVLHHSLSGTSTTMTFRRLAHVLDMMVKAGADINGSFCSMENYPLIYHYVSDIDIARWCFQHRVDTSVITREGSTVWSSELITVGSLANMLDYNVDLSLTAISHKENGTPLVYLLGQHRFAHCYDAVTILVDIECSLSGISNFLMTPRGEKLRNGEQKIKRLVNVIMRKCSGTKSLMASSRLVILKHMGFGPIDGKVDQLRLPVNLKSCLYWRNYISQLPSDLRLTSPDVDLWPRHWITR